MLNIVSKVYAACDFTPGGANGTEGFKLSDCYLLNAKGDTVESVYTDPGMLVNLIVRNLFIIAGVIFFIMMIMAGYQFISGGTKGADQARQMMTTAVAGLIVMFAAFWILQIVKLVTGAEILI